MPASLYGVRKWRRRVNERTSFDKTTAAVEEEEEGEENDDKEEEDDEEREWDRDEMGG